MGEMQEVYIKDFDGWNVQKKDLEKKQLDIFYPRIRQIWYVKLGINIGFESDGKGEYTRPMLIIQKIGSLYWCVPMTSKQKTDVFHYTLKSFYSGSKISSLMLSQARIVDKKRFHEMLGYVSEEEFGVIKKLLRDMYLPEAS